MDNSSAQWPQGIGVVNKAGDHHQIAGSVDQQQKRTTLAGRPQKDQIVNCPRCNSVNTKFCYYNNYSLSQPRYFCKTCRRYWTAGGSLRNVPVGGGSRKNRRSSSSTSLLERAAAAASQSPQVQEVVAKLSSPSSSLHQPGHDLNLSFPPHPTTHDDQLHHHYSNNTNPTFITKPNFGIDHLSSGKLLLAHLPNPNSTTTMTPLLPPMGLFKSTSSVAVGNAVDSREMTMMIIPPDISNSSSASIFCSVGFPPIIHQDQLLFKPSSSNFSLDGFSGHEDGYAASSLQLGVQQQNNDGAGARLLFPFNQENLLNKQQASSAAAAAPSRDDVQSFDHQQNRASVQGGGGGADVSSSTGFWTGMLGGGSW